MGEGRGPNTELSALKELVNIVLSGLRWQTDDAATSDRRFRVVIGDRNILNNNGSDW